MLGLSVAVKGFNMTKSLFEAPGMVLRCTLSYYEYLMLLIHKVMSEPR